MKEIRNDQLTNPVENQRKRLRKRAVIDDEEEEKEQPFLEGDEVEGQAKSLEEERTEVIKLCAVAEDGGDSVNEDEDSVEFASEDSSDEETTGVMTRGRRKRQRDGAFLEESLQDEGSDQDHAMDELEMEYLSDDEQAKAEKAKMKKERTVTRRHRADVDEAKLEGDEQVETLFIDNLPNNEHDILVMLRECKKYIQ